MPTDVATCVVCGAQVDSAADLVMRKDGLDLLRCRVCGLVMRATLPSVEELPDIYSPEYFLHMEDRPADGYANYIGDELLHRQAARRRLRLLERFAASKGRLLDVGAAAGFFVDEAIGAGWEAEGVDVARPMVDWGRSRGLPLGLGALDLLDQVEAFAAVTMWDYIEHAVDPRSDLRRCRRLLAADGVLAISTGDIASLVARLSGSRWHLLTPRHHNFFFSADTLRRLLEECGFDVLFVRHPGARYSAAHLAYKLDRSVRLRLTNALATLASSSPLGRIALPVNLFDIVTVVARKSS